MGWRKGEEGFELTSRIPAQVKSHLILPAPPEMKQVRINGEEVKPDRLPEGVESMEIGEEEVEIRIGKGGEWTLSLSGKGEPSS